MKIDLQPLLENDKIMLRPLREMDFEVLYRVAADPAIWKQHPNKDRWQERVFRNFFEGAMQSGGAFLILNKDKGEPVGSTRFYGYHETEKSISIGYTFYATSCWGKGINTAVKGIMLNYAFGFAEKVFFHIGAENIRSQIAIERLGAVKIAAKEIAYYGERPAQNYIYEIRKADWQTI